MSSSNRIPVSHAGVLPRPPGLKEMLESDPNTAETRRHLATAVADVVRRQADIGIDIVNDGEYSKVRGFSEYVRERLGGIEEGKGDHKRLSIMARDARDFPGFIGTKFANWGSEVAVCAGPLAYIGADITQADIANFKSALKGHDVRGYLPSVAPGTIEHWLHDEHYHDDEEFLFAIADAMAQEFKAITDAGLLLQIDDPDLPDGWQMFPDMSVREYRKYAALRVEALNHALKKIPREMIRLHICWGSNHGPHKNDIPFEDIIDLVLRVKAGCVSFEFANPRHAHEWRVWQHVKLRDGTTIMPGVVGHATDIIEHPRLVADRLVTFANIVGRDNVIAGTDCGLASRLSHAELTWAKLEALVEGARLASKELWRSAGNGSRGAKRKPAGARAAKRRSRRTGPKGARKLQKRRAARGRRG